MITADTPHLLIVDDHQDIRDSLGVYMRRNGKRATTAAHASQARAILSQERIDLVILDIMMPGEDGLALCRSIRESNGPPVILVSARTDDVDRIVGLEIGSDDYVSKPFNPRELLARVDAVLRRSQAMPSKHIAPKDELSFAQWTLRVGPRELVRSDGHSEGLSTSEFQLLMTFLKRPGIALSRDQLLDMSHHKGLEVFDRVIDTQVSRLRKILEDDPKEPKLIKTIWGVGYLFAADVVVS